MLKLAIVFIILGYVASGCSHLELKQPSDVHFKVNSARQI